MHRPGRKQKQPGRVGKWLDKYAHEDVHAGKFIHRGGKRTGVNGKKLAEHVGMEQPTLARILSGEIQNPDDDTVRRISERTRRPIAEIRGEVADQLDLGLTPTAKSIGQGFEQLPDAAKTFTASLIMGFLDFQNAQPALAKLMFGKLDPKAQERVNAGIEKYQAEHQKPELAPKDEGD